ncbi:MAG TPA: TIGR02117 family protein [Burkholderiaceae bacterium]|jgi:uncharacterized protein (TIGR02117 family)
MKKKYLSRAAWITVLLPALYFCAALLLGLVPINRDFSEPQEGIDVYLRANAVHADLILPALSVQREWSKRPQGPALTDFVAVGWGDRAFYLQTRNWSDLRAGNAMNALLGLDRSVLHVAAENQPGAAEDIVRIRVSNAQFSAILAQIDAAFELDQDGKPRLIPGAHYADNDKFYEAKGRYSMFSTCNEWVRTVLSQAGIRTATWAPFAPALLFQARQVETWPKTGPKSGPKSGPNPPAMH